MQVFLDAPRRDRGGALRPSYRSQIQNPLTGARLSLRATSQGELFERVAAVRRVGHEAATGLVSITEANAKIEAIRFGRLAMSAAAETLGEAWDVWAAERDGTDSQDRIRRSGRRTCEELMALPLLAFTDEVLEGFARRLRREGRAPNYVRSLLYLVTGCIRAALRRGVIRRLPWEHFRIAKAEVLRTPAATDSVDVLFALASEARADDARRAKRGGYSDLEARVWTISLCGLRAGEAAGLGWDHVDLERGTVTIEWQALDQWRTRFAPRERPNFRVKGRRVCTLRLHPELLEMLRALRERQRAAGLYRVDGPVFPSRAKEHVGRSEWALNANALYPREIRAWALRAGLGDAPRWVVHSLRHTNIQLELRFGGDLEATRARARHASLRETEHYARKLAGAPTSIGALGIETKGEER